MVTENQKRDMVRRGYKSEEKYLAARERERIRARCRRLGIEDPCSLPEVNKTPWVYDSDKARASALRRNYGITVDEYDEMLYKQNGVCKICGGIETSSNKWGIKRLAVDHNHDTGKVRGLLCNNCNRGLGLLKDSTELLSNAIKYLKEV